MAKALSKSQIAAEIADKNGITKKQAAAILEQIAQMAYRNAKNTFTLPGLGKLVLVNRKARIGRNPATGSKGRDPGPKVISAAFCDPADSKYFADRGRCEAGESAGFFILLKDEDRRRRLWRRRQLLRRQVVP